MPSVSPGRPPPPSAKNTNGQPLALGDLEEPVLLAVVVEALRAGEDRVVVRGHGHGYAVDRADAADEAVGRGLLAELLGAAALALRGDDERAVLDERTLVEQVGDVLPSGALAELACAWPRRPGGSRRGRARGARTPRRGRGGCGRGRRRRPQRSRSRPTSAGSRSTRWCPANTASPSATSTDRTMPGCEAGTTCSIFIASMIATVAPAATSSPSRDLDPDDGALQRRGRPPPGHPVGFRS